MIYFSINYVTLLVVYCIILYFISFETILCEKIALSLSNAPTYLSNQYHLVEDILLPIIESNSYNLILPINSLGLANRLRTIASIYSILVHKYNSRLNSNHNNDTTTDKFHLIVIWISSIECPVLFSDLFQSIDLNMITIISIYEEDILNFSYVMKQLFLPQMQLKFNYKFKEYYYTKFLLSNHNSYIKWNEYNINIIWTRGSHSSVDIESCKEYLQLKNLFYRNLVPCVQVQEIMNGFPFVSTHNVVNSNNDFIVGIHIRAFDQKYDWAVVHPIQNKLQLSIINQINNNNNNKSHTLYITLTTNDSSDSTSNVQRSRRFDEVQSLDIFIAYINQMIVLHPTIKFFIASNSITVKQLIQKQFPVDRLYMISSPVSTTDDRSTLYGMIMATAEFLLLGHTSWIVHTMGSSFARESGCIQQVPVIDITMWQYSDSDTVSASITERVCFYSQHIDLPYCQMPEYIRDITYERHNTLTKHSNNYNNTNNNNNNNNNNSDHSITTTTNSHEIYLEGDEVRTKPLHNVHSINNRTINISNLVCYMDNERQMCTMSYLICSCQDLILHNLSLSYNVKIYDGLFCYVDINYLNIVDTPTTKVSNTSYSNQNVLIDCYLLLAESNGYSL